MKQRARRAKGGVRLGGRCRAEGDGFGGLHYMEFGKTGIECRGPVYIYVYVLEMVRYTQDNRILL